MKNLRQSILTLNYEVSMDWDSLSKCLIDNKLCTHETCSLVQNVTAQENRVKDNKY